MVVLINDRDYFLVCFGASFQSYSHKNVEKTNTKRKWKAQDWKETENSFSCRQIEAK